MIVANFKDGYLGQGRCEHCKWAEWALKPRVGLHCEHPKLKPNNQGAKRCSEIRKTYQNACGPDGKLWEKLY